MAKPGFELQWTSKLDNQPRQLNGAHAGRHGQWRHAVRADVARRRQLQQRLRASTTTPATSSGSAISTRTLPAATAACAGGITAAATRIVSVAPPPIADAGARAWRRTRRRRVSQHGRRTRRGRAGRSTRWWPRRGAAPSEPGAGQRAGGPGAAPAAPAAVRRPQAPARGAGAAAQPAPRRRRRQRAGGRARARGGGRGGEQGNAGIPGAPNGGGPGGGFGRPSGVVYAVSSDGMLHVLGLQSGKDIQRPAQFPAGQRALVRRDRRRHDPVRRHVRRLRRRAERRVGHRSRSGSKPVVSWRTNGGSVVGASHSPPTARRRRRAVRVRPTTATAMPTPSSRSIRRRSQVKDWFTPADCRVRHRARRFSGTTTRTSSAAATRDGRVLLLDAASLGGANHATPLYASRSFLGAGGSFAADALASWQEMTITPAPAPAAGAPPAPPAPPTVTLGTRWILAPVSGALPAACSRRTAPSTNGSVLALRLTETGGALVARGRLDVQQPVGTVHPAHRQRRRVRALDWPARRRDRGRDGGRAYGPMTASPASCSGTATRR